MKNHPTYPYHCAWVAPRISRWMLIVLLSLTSTFVSQAQVEIFMRFFSSTSDDALPGNSDDPAFKSTEGWCRVRSFSLGAEFTSDSSSTGGAKTGKLGSVALDIGKEVNVISPSIFIGLATGSHYPKMEIAVRKRGARSEEAYLKYEFLRAIPRRLSWAGSEEEPIETTRFEYSAFRLTVRSQSSTGELGTPVMAAWDFVHNKPGFESALD